jgi:hypothetical protein
MKHAKVDFGFVGSGLAVVRLYLPVWAETPRLWPTTRPAGYPDMKAYRVMVEGCECIVFEVSAFWARAVACNAFKQVYRCQTRPETICERVPYLDHYFDETHVGTAWDENSLGEGAPTAAFGGGF